MCGAEDSKVHSTQNSASTNCRMLLWAHVSLVSLLQTGSRVYLEFIHVNTVWVFHKVQVKPVKPCEQTQCCWLLDWCGAAGRGELWDAPSSEEMFGEVWIQWGLTPPAQPHAGTTFSLTDYISQNAILRGRKRFRRWSGSVLQWHEIWASAVQTVQCERPLQPHCILQKLMWTQLQTVNTSTIKSIFVQINLKFYTKITKQTWFLSL